MEDAYKIIGGRPLHGSVRLSGAKNVALKTIIASLLFRGEVILENVPRISDVSELLHLITSLGAEARFTDLNTIRINASTMAENKVDMLHASKIRVSFMLFAPLLHHFRECLVPNPGGCRIGARPIDRIIEGMRQIGVSVQYDSQSGYYQATLDHDLQGEYTFTKPTHTGTELLIMLATLGKSKVVLHNTALEPEIDELIRFLNQSGAKIERKGTNINIEGVSALSRREPFRIFPDRNEAVTFAVLGIATKGDVTIENAQPQYLETFLSTLQHAGGRVEQIGDQKLRFFFESRLRATDVETAPHPGFMTDWQPNWAVLMTQADGESTIHERVFESRFAYVAELKKLGAKIEFFDPAVSDSPTFYHFPHDSIVNHQRMIKIYGPTELHNGVLAIHDLRAGASLVIASLVAHGESVVEGASIVERGYENIEEKIRGIGGEIEKI